MTFDEIQNWLHQIIVTITLASGPLYPTVLIWGQSLWVQYILYQLYIYLASSDPVGSNYIISHPAYLISNYIRTEILFVKMQLEEICCMIVTKYVPSSQGSFKRFYWAFFIKIIEYCRILEFTYRIGDTSKQNYFLIYIYKRNILYNDKQRMIILWCFFKLTDHLPICLSYKINTNSHNSKIHAIISFPPYQLYVIQYF